MCLENVKTKKPYVAKSDIIGYKVVVKIGNAYYTPYRYMKIETGVDYTENKFQTTPDGYWNKISMGFHIFNTKSKAMSKKKYDFSWGTVSFNGQIDLVRGEITVLKAIIPAGSMFWRGNLGKSRNMCSERIRYEEL